MTAHGPEIVVETLLKYFLAIFDDTLAKKDRGGYLSSTEERYHSSSATIILSSQTLPQDNDASELWRGPDHDRWIAVTACFDEFIVAN